MKPELERASSIFQIWNSSFRELELYKRLVDLVIPLRHTFTVTNSSVNCTDQVKLAFQNHCTKEPQQVLLLDLVT